MKPKQQEKHETNKMKPIFFLAESIVPNAFRVIGCCRCWNIRNSVEETQEQEIQEQEIKHTKKCKERCTGTGFLFGQWNPVPVPGV